jgi:hydrogenase maturation protease
VTKRILVLGYGNPSRRDDGLGPAFAEAIDRMNFDGVTVDAGYQLGIEDAVDIADYDEVLFVDAAGEGTEPFSFERLSPELSTSFTTHRVRPSFVLAIAREVFDAETKGYLLGIRGYELDELEEGLSKGARANLDAALRFVAQALETGDRLLPFYAARCNHA